MSSGALIITDRIDREELCGQSSVCRLQTELVIDDPLEMHRLEVVVIDVNDNAPEFLENENVLNIPEFAATGTRFPIPKALDVDIGKNTIQGYILSPNSNFDLKTTTHPDGRKSAELVLAQALDREVRPVHELVLTAFDGGDPKRSGSTQITIKVIDANDNGPTFNQSVYHVKLLENVPIGTTVATLTARDVDEGRNAEVSYSFNKGVSTSIQQVFHMEETTGVITLTAGVDFEGTTVYHFSVEARDKGHTPMAGLCDVVVQIMDINDNPPVIAVSSWSASVPEDAIPGTVIALLTVSDRFSGPMERCCAVYPQHSHSSYTTPSTTTTP
ncbi:protocadherin gamma-C3-like [Ambystoma mexicanum]|uniref:protocadherin gamma-C3-like n=1 Tax=Ambystoma mexicanum TaxID=8296 RepID=UPI0037E73A7E